MNSKIEMLDMFDEKGNVINGDFWPEFCVNFDNKLIKAPRTRIKEWDFYQFQTGDWVLQTTIAYCLVVDLYGAGLFNIRTGERYEVSKILPHLPHSLKMPKNPNRDNTINLKLHDFEFRVSSVYGHKKIRVKAKTKTLDEFDFEINAQGKYPANPKVAPGADSQTAFTILHNFKESPRMFYLNYKENFFNATARVHAKKVGHEAPLDLTAEQMGGVLDFGRGYWPFHNEWFWGNYSGFTADGKPFGLNLGYGFGKCPGTENFIYYNGKAYKINKIKANYNSKNEKSHLEILDDSHHLRLNLSFIFDNYTQTKFLWYNKWCHQYFYEANADVTLDGEKIKLENFIMFFEHEENHW